LSTTSGVILRTDTHTKAEVITHQQRGRKPVHFSTAVAAALSTTGILSLACTLPYYKALVISPTELSAVWYWAGLPVGSICSYVTLKDV